MHAFSKALIHHDFDTKLKMMDIFQSELIGKIENIPLSTEDSVSDDSEVHELASSSNYVGLSNYYRDRGFSTYSVVHNEMIAEEDSIAPNMSSIEKGWRNGYKATHEIELEIKKKMSAEGL